MIIPRLKKIFDRPENFGRYHKLASWDDEVKSYMQSFMVNSIKEISGKPQVIDFGGGDGLFIRGFLEEYIDGIDLYSLDLEDHGLPNTILHDANIPISSDWDEQFDLVFSSDMMEHLREPGVAADSMTRMLSPNGMLLVSSVLAWRYHPVPKDYYRFSDDGLRYLFSERNSITEISCGFDLSRRRENIKGGFFRDEDIPPLDLFGGFRENWRVFYIGRKT